jgi:hypothetical protein
MTGADTVLIIREAEIIFMSAISIHPGRMRGESFKGIKLKKKTPCVIDPIIFKTLPNSIFNNLKPHTNRSEKEVYNEKRIIFNSDYF